MVEIEEYFEKISNLLSYPDSKRLFSELHSESIKILKKEGMPSLSWVPKQIFNYENSEKEIRFHLIYEKYILHDKLDIMFYNTGNSLEFVMRRLRGYKIKEELENEDLFSRTAKGKGVLYIISKVLEYQPCALGIRENESQRIIEY